MFLYCSWVYRPLHWHGWLAIIAVIVVVTFVLNKFTCWSQQASSFVDPMGNALNSLWYIVGAFLQQGLFKQFV